jgi:hypothetical protein
MNVTSSAGIAPAWTATKPEPAARTDQPDHNANEPRERAVRKVAEKPAEPRRPLVPQGQGTRVDIRA